VLAHPKLAAMLEVTDRIRAGTRTRSTAEGRVGRANRT
jgi:hypothetical protein